MSPAHWVSYCKSSVKGDYLVQACLSGALFPCKGSEEAYYKAPGGGGGIIEDLWYFNLLVFSHRESFRSYVSSCLKKWISHL